MKDLVFVITPIVDKSHAQTLHESMEPLQIVDQRTENNWDSFSNLPKKIGGLPLFSKH